MDLVDVLFFGLVVWFMVFARRVADVVGGPEWFDVAYDFYCAESEEDLAEARARFERVRVGC